MELKDTWDFHAFPDVKTENETYRLDDSASLERERIRKEIYIEQTTDYRMRRHTSDDDQSPAGRRAAKSGRIDDLMLLAVGSPAYIEAYNNQLTFTLGDEEIEITQGELHDIAKQYAENLQVRIREGRRAGLDPADIALMTAELGHVEQVVVISDPQYGKMHDQDQVRAQHEIKQSPGLILKIESTLSTEFYSSKVIESEAGKEPTSFASTIEKSPLDNQGVSAMQDFNIAAVDSPVIDSEPEKHAPVTQDTGFTL